MSIFVVRRSDDRRLLFFDGALSTLPQESRCHHRVQSDTIDIVVCDPCAEEARRLGPAVKTINISQTRGARMTRRVGLSDESR